MITMNICKAINDGQSVAQALESGAYTVAGTGLCGLGSVLDTAADIGQKVVDATRAAGEACTAKGEEFKAKAAELKGEQPAKKEEKKAAPQAQKAAAAPAQAQVNKTWSLADFVAQHNEFAAAATSICKEFTKVIFRAEGSVKGVVTAFDAVRRADGAHCSIFADMAEKTFSVVATPVKKEEKPAKKAAKKAAAPKQEKASKKAAPAKEAVKAEPAKTEEAKEVANMKAALEAARAKKTAAKAKTVKVEAKKEEKSSDKAVKTVSAKKAVKADAAADKELAAEAELAGADDKVVYSVNEKANEVLKKAVAEHGKWLEAVICYFRNSSATSPIRNAVLTKNCLKFSYYPLVNLQSAEKAVSIGLKSKKVKVDRKPVDIAF